MPEVNTATPTPLPLVVPAEEFEARVPEAHRPLYAEDDGGKKRRLLVDFGADNPGALANALARKKADYDALKAKFDPLAALGTPEEIAEAVAKAKAPPTPEDGKADAALQSAKDSLAAMAAKVDAHKAREQELQAAADAAKNRWLETERRNDLLREMTGQVKPGGVKTILRILMENSRTDLDEAGAPMTVHLDDKGQEAYGDKLERLTTPEKLFKLRNDPDWKDFFIPSPANGSGATPGRNGAPGSKTITMAQFNTLNPAEQMAFSREVIAGKATLTD